MRDREKPSDEDAECAFVTSWPAKPVRTSVLAALLLVLAAGCAKEPPPNPYPQELVDNFMTGCRQRSSASICECALNRIQHRWTADEFQKLDQTLGDGDAAAAQIAETVASCAGR